MAQKQTGPRVSAPGPADYSVDVHRRGNPTLAGRLSPTEPETALAAAYAEALRRRAVQS